MNESGIAVEQLKTNDRGAMRMFLRNKAAVVGLVVFVFILYGTSANKMVSRPFLAPSDDLAPLLGTDYLGRDILAGVVGGGRTTLLVAAVAAAMTMTIGIVIGSLAGYFGGWVDALLMRQSRQGHRV